MHEDGKDKKDTATRSQLTNAEYHLSRRQMEHIINTASSPRDSLIVRLLAETGLRRGELAVVRVEDIRNQERLLLVRRGKGNKARLVPLTMAVIKNFELVIGTRRSGPVFVTSRERAISVRQINRIVAQIGIAAGVANPNPKYDHITPHLFRHSFARLWKNRGGSIEALSKIMGHQSTATTWDLYGTMSLTDIERDYRRVMERE